MDKLKVAKAAHKAGLTPEEYIADKENKAKEQEILKQEIEKRIGYKYQEIMVHIAKISIAAEIVLNESKFLEDNKKYMTKGMNDQIKTINRNIDAFLRKLRNKLSKEQKEGLETMVEGYYDIVSNLIALKYKDLIEVNDLIMKLANPYCEIIED
jgi:hypothetical protein